MRKSLWDGWEIKDKIGEGRFAEVYKAVKKVDGVNINSAIKYVSLPKNQEELNELVKNGIIKNVQQANDYYLKIIDDLKKEINLMKKFKGNNNIIDFFDYIHENKYDGTGVDFYIRMELAEDLDSYFSNRKPTTQDVLKLGIDICNALEVCASLKIVHKDIKPGNIYIGTDGNYKLGDFGIASSFEGDDNHFIGTYNYMAPEVYNKRQVDYSTDLYSLGIVMYKLLNNNKLPFATKFSSDKDILKTRMSGIQLFPIKGVDKNLMDIIIKACSYENKDRYKDATAMKKALEKVLGNNIEDKNTFSGEKTVSIYDVEANDVINSKNMSSNNKINIFNINNFDLKGFIEKLRYNLKSNKFFKVIVISILVLLVLLLIRGCVSAKKCDSGFVNNNGLCVKGYYYCDEGYYLNSDNKCQKTIESFEAKLRLKCDDGYVLDGDTCIKNDTKKPESGYQCAPGFTLNGNKCVGEEKAAPNVSYNCSGGYTLVGDSCVKATTMEASVSYSCPSRYSRNGTKCNYTESNSSYIKISESCPSGYEKSSYTGKCCKRNYWTPSCVEPTVTKSCSKGTYNGTTCVITNTVEATVNYSCPAGYELMLNQCVKTEQRKPNINVSCSNGYTLKDNICYTKITVDAISGYKCDNGYVFTGELCVSNDKKAAEKKYSCSKAYTLNGDKCEKYTLKYAKVHYTE